MVTGPGVTVVPLGAESLHQAREFLDALQECGFAGRSVNTPELRQGNGFNDAVCTAGRVI
jgi:hypothetical protein